MRHSGASRSKSPGVMSVQSRSRRSLTDAPLPVHSARLSVVRRAADDASHGAARQRDVGHTRVPVTHGGADPSVLCTPQS
ncbi:hypothetical protein FHS37_005368 [Streptomyces griseostramineus]|uniref:Uncharacterized protein n=1 Tax=Streptomyces griseomycini TaxID=66895 RepID=A0A7W7PU06_9ACTN|nr:hypothetical protein [Streptomyces griseomycini]